MTQLDIYGVIGDPIDHSRSPQIHELFAKQTNQNLIYEAMRVEKGEVIEMLDTFQESGCKGLNITSPHKQEAFQLVDEVTQLLVEKGVRLSEPPQLLGIAVVMRLAVTGLRDADVRDRTAVGFAANHAGNDSRHVGAQRQDHEVKEGAVVFLHPAHVQLCREAVRRSGWQVGAGNIQPRISPVRANLHLSNGREILIELVAVA